MRRLIAALSGIIILIGLSSLVFAIFRLPGQSSQIAWEASPGLTRTIVWDIAVAEENPDVIYAGTDNGPYHSSDGGASWSAIELDPFLRSLNQTSFDRIRDIHLTPAGEILVATWGGGVYWSETGQPDSWLPLFAPQDTEENPNYLNSFLHTRKLVAAGANRETIYVGTDGGVLSVDRETFSLQPTGLALGSSDLCATQAQTNTHLNLGTSVAIHLRDLIAHPNDPRHLYAAIADFGVCESADSGESWAKLGDGPEKSTLEAEVIAISPKEPTTIYLGTFGQGIYRSDDGGKNWTSWNRGDLPAEADIWSLRFGAGGETLYAGTRYDGTFVLPAGGTWQPVETLPFGALSLTVDPNGAMLAGTWGGGILRQSSDTGDWQTLNMPALPLRINALVKNDAGLFVGTANDGVWRSLNRAQSWDRVVGQQPQANALSGENALEGPALNVATLLVGGDHHTLYAGTGNGLYISDDNANTWQGPAGGEKPLLDIVSLLEVKGDGSDVVLAGTRSQGLRLFSAGAGAWDEEVQGLSGHVNALARFQDKIYASVVGIGLFEASAAIPPAGLNEASWAPANLPPRFIQKLIATTTTPWQQMRGGSSNQLFAITERGLYRTQDGENWLQVNPGSFSALAVDAPHPQVSYLSVFTTTYAVADAGQSTSGEAAGEFALLLSTNNGSGWNNTKASDRAQTLTTPVVSMIAGGTQSGRLYAATRTGLFVGQVALPPLWREIFFYLGLSLIAIGAILLVAIPYLLVSLPYHIPLPRAAYLLLAHFSQLQLVWERGGKTRLSDLEQLLLLFAPGGLFQATDIWRKLDQLGTVPTYAQLQRALGRLADRYHLLTPVGDAYRVRLADLKQIALKTFGQPERLAQTQTHIRNQNSLYQMAERFFVQAGFEVRPLGQEYLLRPETLEHRPWGDTWVWLRPGITLNAAEVTMLADLKVGRDTKGPAFIIVSGRPTLEGYRALAQYNASNASESDDPQLVLLDAQTIRRALLERSAAAALDTMHRRAKPGYDHFALYAPLSDQLNFFGRNKDLQTLSARLSEGNQTVITINGLPKIGLTSLLQQAENLLEGTPCTIVDLRYEQSPETLWYTVTNRLLDDLQHKRANAATTHLLTRLKSARPGDELVLNILQALPFAVEKNEPVGKFVVFVDATGLGSRRIERFREAIHRLVQDNPHLSLVMTTNDLTRPEAAAEAYQLTLRPLSKDEVADMIDNVLAAMGQPSWSGELVDQIYAESGGHPWLVRQLSSALSQYGRVIGRQEVEAAAFELVEARSAFFETLWESLPERVQDALIDEEEEIPAWLNETGLMEKNQIQIGAFGKWLNLEFGLED